MRTIDLAAISFRALLINKARSVLTMLGIVIGIMSVILMLAVGQAAQRYLLSQVASFGSDLIFIANGSEEQERGGPPSDAIKQAITEKDYRDIRALPWVTAANPSIITTDLLSYNGEDRFASVNGSSPDEARIFNLVVKQGRFLEDTDLDSRSRVIVLGKDVAKGMFGEEDPLGKSIRFNRRTFRVIGVLDEAGTRFFSNVDDQVYIPYTTFFDAYNKQRLNFLSLKSGELSPVEAKRRIQELLRDNHNIDNPEGDLGKDDFQVGTQEDSMAAADTIGTVLQVLLGSIASISLVVAGVGIMNIMYVTVTERTREIGLRKAIGATRVHILAQFLAEAVLLTVIAGALGVVAGISLAWLAIVIINSFQSGWTFSIPWNGVLLGFGVSTGIGIVFGYFPARKAATMSPIESLRYE